MLVVMIVRMFSVNYGMLCFFGIVFSLVCSGVGVLVLVFRWCVRFVRWLVLIIVSILCWCGLCFLCRWVVM